MNIQVLNLNNEIVFVLKYIKHAVFRFIMTLVYYLVHLQSSRFNKIGYLN